MRRRHALDLGACSIAGILCLALRSPLCGQQALPEGALLHYDFEDGADPTANAGTLGPAYDGRLHGDATFDSLAGRGALRLDGVDDFVIPLGSSEAFNVGDRDFTFYARFQTSHTSVEAGERGLIWKERTGTGAGMPGVTLGLIKQDGRPRFSLFESDESRAVALVGNLPANDGLPHEILATRKADVLRLHLDGILIGTLPITDRFGSTSNRNDLVIGGRSLEVTGETRLDDFEGLIDEIRVYDFAVEPRPRILLYDDQELACREFPSGQVARTVSFDDLEAGTVLTDQYPGLRFESFNGGTPMILGQLGLAARSGTQVVMTQPCCAGGGGFAIDFEPSVSSFGFFLNDLQFEGSFLDLFDESLDLIARLDLGNVQEGDVSFPFEWRFFGFSSQDAKLARIQVAFASEDHISLDDLWYSVVGEPLHSVRFRRGDANADGSLDISDAVFILGYLFVGGPEPTCLEAADTNDDNYFAAPDVSDGIYLLNWLFVGGPPLNEPQQCGVDPSPCGIGLGCKKFEPCE